MPVTPPDPQSFIPRGVAVRLGLMAAVVAAGLYLVLFWQPETPLDTGNLKRYEPPLVSAPKLDEQILAQAKDKTREQRLFLEKEPLRHLLETAYNVQSAEVARALGMPDQPVEVDTLRADPAAWRGRWIWYKGKIEDISGPSPGHPVDGAGIYEATLRLPSGEPVLFTFSLPPGPGVRIGGWARAEGYLLKLRDLTFPAEMQQVPLLVGAQLQRDYEDWGTVAELEPERLAGIIDTRDDNGTIVPTQDAWRGIDDDQDVPLWHLAAFARAHHDAPMQQWRQIPAINAQETWEGFKKDTVARGTPMRVLGRLVMKRSIAAQPNPAGIESWTEAWVQVRDLGGKTVPIWVPDRCENVEINDDLEVRGYYLRRFAYESRRGQQWWTPLFVAARLDPFEFKIGEGTRQIGLIALCGAAVLILFAWWNNRREVARQAAAEDALIERRRRRRLKQAASAAT